MAVQPVTLPPNIALAFAQAGDKSGVDFEYLLTTAMRESSLDAEAKAPNSSAVGLFQFLESTWLEVMKTEGPRLGYGEYADQIGVTADGDYVIGDSQLRRDVLKLREDPAIAADLAAAFTKRNGDYLEARFGRMPSPGELYIAHFLGAQGAEKMFTAGLADPDQIAATLFPRQAAANRSIFYDQSGARTVREVYQALVARHMQPGSAAFAVQQMAQQPAPAEPAPEPRVQISPGVSFVSLFATASPAPADQAPAPRQLFTRLYAP